MESHLMLMKQIVLVGRVACPEIDKSCDLLANTNPDNGLHILGLYMRNRSAYFQGRWFSRSQLFTSLMARGRVYPRVI